MRNIGIDNITSVAASSFEGLPDARRRELVQKLVLALHAFGKDVGVTHEEWRGALAFLHRCAAITSDSRSEFSLLSDVLGISSLVDLLASVPKATPGSVLGPFHAVGSPWLDNPASLIGDNAGQRVLYVGRVCDTDGSPLPGATLDYWQNAANGLYWQVDDSQPTDNLRCQFKVDAQGGFELATIRPVPYQIPTDGPVWHDLVEPAKRSSWRAAHAHVIVSAPGYRTLVTELFDADDAYLDTDAVFGVREALVGRFEPTDDQALCQRHGLSCGETLVMRVELRLAPDVRPCESARPLQPGDKP
jgi:protocatechuate 3,4-dioxygenase beta subunit